MNLKELHRKPEVNGEQLDKFTKLLVQVSTRLNPKNVAGDLVIIGDRNGSAFLIVRGNFDEKEKLTEARATLFKLESHNPNVTFYKPDLEGSISGLGTVGANILNYSESDLNISINLLDAYFKTKS